MFRGGDHEGGDGSSERCPNRLGVDMSNWGCFGNGRRLVGCGCGRRLRRRGGESSVGLTRRCLWSSDGSGGGLGRGRFTFADGQKRCCTVTCGQGSRCNDGSSSSRHSDAALALLGHLRRRSLFVRSRGRDGGRGRGGGPAVRREAARGIAGAARVPRAGVRATAAGGSGHAHRRRTHLSACARATRLLRALFRWRDGGWSSSSDDWSGIIGSSGGKRRIG